MEVSCLIFVYVWKCYREARAPSDLCQPNRAYPCSLEDVAPLLHVYPCVLVRAHQASDARAGSTHCGRTRHVRARAGISRQLFRLFIRRAQIVSWLRSSRLNFTNQKVKALRGHFLCALYPELLFTLLLEKLNISHSYLWSRRLVVEVG